MTLQLCNLVSKNLSCPRLVLTVALAFLGCVAASGQERSVTERSDSLPPATKTSKPPLRKGAGNYNLQLVKSNLTVSAMGERDPVKFIQTLPGISSGLEGGSAYFVRGGNLGGNVLTLDGVRIYGTSHLFGITSVYSPDLVGSLDFSVGGFSSGEDNLTASHIRIRSTEEFSSKSGRSASVSNFIIGGSAGQRVIGDRLSVFAAARIAPVKAEWNLLKGYAAEKSEYAACISDVSAAVYDLYAKVLFKESSRSKYALSFFNSHDAYWYRYKDSEDNALWGNLVVNLEHDWNSLEGNNLLGVSYNRFATSQGQKMFSYLTTNAMAIRSSIEEVEARFHRHRKRSGVRTLSWDAKARYTVYNPGSSVSIAGEGVVFPTYSPMGNNYRKTASGMLGVQEEWNSPGKYEARVAARASLSAFMPGKPSKAEVVASPEAGVMLRRYLPGNFCIEATADYLVQYNHTLEGVPMGWSLDMTVPSCKGLPPEKTGQVYTGLMYSWGCYSLSAGAYAKRMWNLVYYSDATSLFSSAMAGWEDNIDVGDGWSKGMEILAERTGKVLSGRIAYTLSKTDRRFGSVNHGVVFPSKFDRRHILNVSTEIKFLDNLRTEAGITGFFTYQSGTLETVPVGREIAFDIFGDRIVESNVFTTINNYRMPAYIRLDAGLYARFSKDRHPQYLGIGVYNVLNRHNPCLINYDTEKGEWRKISLIPLMPSLGYRLEF